MHIHYCQKKKTMAEEIKMQGEPETPVEPETPEEELGLDDLPIPAETPEEDNGIEQPIGV